MNRKLQIALIGKANGVGLSTDAELLRSLLASFGHETTHVDPSSPSMPRADVGLFLETVAPHLIDCVRCPIGVLNLEWFEPAWFEHLHRFVEFWAKTECAHATLLRLGLPSHFTGFASRDLLNVTVPRTLTCLHVKGQSPLKNTDAVLRAWDIAPDLPPLTIISKLPIVRRRPNVRVLPSVSQTELEREMNAAEIHLCPSATEGWGHYITEAMSTMATVVTTDGAPMNEHIDRACGILVRPSGARPRPLGSMPLSADAFSRARLLLTTPAADLCDGLLDRILFERPQTARSHLPSLATEYAVDPYVLAGAVRAAASIPTEHRRLLGFNARRRLLERNAEFHRRVFERLARL